MGGIRAKGVLLAATMTTAMGVGAPAASAAVSAEPIHSPLGTAPVPGGTNAVCALVGPASASPGYTLLTPTSGIEDSGGETATLICTGTFNGHLVTGPGTFGYKATYAGTCLASHVVGGFSDTIPTDAGLMHFAGTYDDIAIGQEDQFVADAPGARLTGFDVAEPLPGGGDCVTTPETKAVGESIILATD